MKHHRDTFYVNQVSCISQVVLLSNSLNTYIVIFGGVRNKTVKMWL